MRTCTRALEHEHAQPRARTGSRSHRLAHTHVRSRARANALVHALAREVLSRFAVRATMEPTAC
eukprot:939265-Pleurochrysis_carterae.AAC.1